MSVGLQLRDFSRSNDVADMDVRDRLTSALADLRTAVEFGDRKDIDEAANRVRVHSAAVTEQDIAEMCGVDRLASQLSDAGIPPTLFLADLRSTADRTDYVIDILADDMQETISTDGEVAVIVNGTPDRWKRVCDQIRATGKCPDCNESTIGRDTGRAGSVGAVEIFSCWSCSFEIPYVA